MSWNVDNSEDINEDSLSLFYALEPKIDVLVLGIGEETVTPEFRKRIMAFMQKYKINTEILGTESVSFFFQNGSLPILGDNDFFFLK